MVYPDRYLVSKKIKENGFNNILDGFLGDVMLGGSYYRSDRGFSVNVRLARYATVFKDLAVSKIGLESISTALAKDISVVRDLREKFPFLSSEFAHEIEKHRPYLLEDIERECERVVPENDSLGLLYRNFLLHNRGLHAIAQQGVMCRSHLRPLYPFTNDRDLFNFCLRLTPESTAYRKSYVRLFKTQFPEYAKITYGDSMIALKYRPFVHGAYKLLARSEAAVFGVDNRKLKLSVSPNNWSWWLRNSERLRDKLTSDLTGSDIVDKRELDKFIVQIRNGEREGGGLFHLASIAKWMS